MIAIVEGIDRVGKSTLCEKLMKAGFICLKDFENIKVDSIFRPIYLLAKTDTTISYLYMLDRQDINVVVDRLHLSEYVYGSIERTTSKDTIMEFDRMLAKMNTALILVKPIDVKWSSEKAEKDLSQYDILFNKVFAESKIKNKFETNFKMLDSTCESIIKLRNEVRRG